MHCMTAVSLEMSDEPYFCSTCLCSLSTHKSRKASSKIWSDKVSLLHIKGTQRGGEHGGAEGTKSDRGIAYVLLIALVINVLRNLVNHCFVRK